jgi:hypothetical protein
LLTPLLTSLCIRNSALVMTQAILMVLVSLSCPISSSSSSVGFLRESPSVNMAHSPQLEQNETSPSWGGTESSLMAWEALVS